MLTTKDNEVRTADVPERFQVRIKKKKKDKKNSNEKNNFKTI